MSRPWRPNVPFDKGSHEERLHKTYLREYRQQERESGPMHDRDCYGKDYPEEGHQG